MDKAEPGEKVPVGIAGHVCTFGHVDKAEPGEKVPVGIAVKKLS